MPDPIHTPCVSRISFPCLMPSHRQFVRVILQSFPVPRHSLASTPNLSMLLPPPQPRTAKIPPSASHPRYHHILLASVLPPLLQNHDKDVIHQLPASPPESTLPPHHHQSAPMPQLDLGYRQTPESFLSERQRRSGPSRADAMIGQPLVQVSE